MRSRGFLFLAPPTVVQELEKTSKRVTSEYVSALAQNTLDNPQALDLVLGTFADLQRDVTDIHIARIMDRNILSEENKGDIFAMIESAYLDCLLYITDVPEVLNARGQLTLSLIQDCGMTSMYIFSPSEIVLFFRDGHTPAS